VVPAPWAATRQTVGFLALFAVGFLIVTIQDEVRALREGRENAAPQTELLNGTPLAAYSHGDSGGAPPMPRPE
jgi:hypothetical protein